MADIAIGVFGHGISVGGTPSSTTVAFDTTGMVDPTLVFGCYTYKAGSQPDGVASVTFNGVALTRVTSFVNTTDTSERIYMYVLPNCPIGNYNLVITYQNSISSCEASYGCYQNTDTTTQPDAYGTGGNARSNNHQLTVVSATDRCWAVGFWRGLVTYSAGSGTTLRDGYAGNNHALGDSNGVVTPAGSKTIAFTTPTSDGWGGIVIALRPKPSISLVGNERTPIRGVMRGTMRP